MQLADTVRDFNDTPSLQKMTVLVNTDRGSFVSTMNDVSLGYTILSPCFQSAIHFSVRTVTDFGEEERVRVIRLAAVACVQCEDHVFRNRKILLQNCVGTNDVEFMERKRLALDKDHAGLRHFNSVSEWLQL